MWPNIFDNKFYVLQHCRPYLPRGILWGSPWLIVADVGALLLPFGTLLAPVWHPFGMFLQFVGKFAGLP